jgi:hypothetical protein
MRSSSGSFARFEQARPVESLKLFHEAAVLFHRSHRDANPLGKFVASHGPDDNASLEERFENGISITHLNQNKIRNARHKG